MEAPILSEWTKSDQERSDEAMVLAVQRLKANADAAVVEAKQKVLDAKALCVKARREALKNPNFAAIAHADLALKAAELELSNMEKVYTSVLG